ncbi:hypothetical protein OAG35_01805 [bacterium]|nr:hypothetical protein [bacterium]
MDLGVQEALGSGLNGNVDAILRYPGGNRILAVAFDLFDGQLRHGVARLNQDTK